MSTIYLAGPMRGYKWYNFDAFDAAENDADVRIHGEVISPAQMDRDHGFNPFTLSEDHDWNTLPADFDVSEVMRRDLEAVMRCDMVYMLRGWEASNGANAERSLALTLGKSILYQPGASMPGTPPESEIETDGEVRVVHPTTGGEKGQKIERFDLIPPLPLQQLAKLYGKGAEKYAANNWREGYYWSLSFSACMRHLWAFWDGEDIDAGTGVPHVTCAAFHCFALAQYLSDFPEGDNRFKKETVSTSSTGVMSNEEYLDVLVYAGRKESMWKCSVSVDTNTGEVSTSSQPFYSPKTTLAYQEVLWASVPSDISEALLREIAKAKVDVVEAYRKTKGTG